MREGWVQTTLGEVTAVNPGRLKRVAPDDVIRYVDISSVSWDSGIDICSVAAMPFGQAPGRARRPINEKDVVVSTVRPRLRDMGQVPPSLAGQVASTGLCVLRAHDSQVILPDYVWQVVRHQPFTDWLVERETGSNYPAVRSSDIEAYPFLLPPIEEQRRIVDLMSHLDAACESLRMEAARLKALFRNLLRKATKPRVDAQPLMEVVDLLDRYRVPVNSRERANRLGDVPYYGAAGQAGWIDRALFDEPLVLLGEDGAGLELWDERPIAYRIDGPAWVNNHAHVLRATHVTTDWLLLTLMHYDISLLLASGTRPKLTQSALAGIKVNTTDTSQDEALCMSLLDGMRSRSEEVSRLTALRTALLSGLLSGRHQIPNSYDEFIRDEGAA